MATLQEIADKSIKCGSSAADTGQLGCQVEFGTPLHGIGMKKGFTIPKDTVFDLEYIAEQTQLGNFIPAISADSFEDLSSEDGLYTNSRGVEKLSTPGLAKYKLTFQSGHEFYKELSKLTSFKSLDWIWADDAGNWRMAVTSNGDFKGFSSGQTLAMMTKTKVQGGDPESKSLTVQMLSRSEWDYNYAIVERMLLTFEPEEVDGVNGVEVILAPAAPAATSISFKIVLAADRDTPVSGLETADFLYTVNGTQTVITVTESAVEPGLYTGVVAATVATKVLQVGTFDSTKTVTAVIKEGVLYRGASNAVTVV